MRAFVMVAFAWLLGTGVLSRAAAREQYAGVDDKWRRYQSPHFELFSRQGAEESRRLLHNLEFLHTVFLDTLHLTERRPVEVTVYYFGSMRDFRAYLQPQSRGNENVGGFYLNRPDRAVIVLPPAEDWEEEQRPIFHEYIHHLTYITGDEPALWYLEGIAELFSTIKEEPDGFILGRPIEEHVEFLRFHGLMPLESLFSTLHNSPNYNETTRAGYFYAESWALLHFWYFGRSDLPREKLDRFVNYSRMDEENRDPQQRLEQFRLSAGMDYGAMAERLRRYIADGRYGWSKFPLPKMAARETYAVRPVSRDEIREQLTELDYRVNSSPLAKLALLEGVEKHPDEPRRFELLGSIALIEGDETEAHERWQQALAAGSVNPAVFHELAMVENRRWFSQFDPIYFRLPDETAQYLRTLLKRSIKAAPDQIQAYEMLAWVEAMTDQPSVANVNLVQAHYNTLKQKSRTVVALALVRVRLKDEAGARDLLNELEKTAPGPEIVRIVTIIRNYLDAQHPPEP